MPVGFKRLRLKFRKQFALSHDILRHYVGSRTMWSNEGLCSDDRAIRSA
jgi:hypothetical protein